MILCCRPTRRGRGVARGREGSHQRGITAAAALLRLALLLILMAPPDAHAYDEDKFTRLAPILVGKDCTMKVDAEVVSGPGKLGELALAMDRNDRAKYEAMRSAGHFFVVRQAYKARVLEARWIRVTKAQGVGALHIRLLSRFNSGTDGWITFRQCV